MTSLFNNKLQKVQMAMLGQDVQDKFDNLSKGVSEYEWTATAGQVTYVLPSGQTYDTTSKWLEVFVGGAPIPDSQIQKDSSTQFTLLIDSSKIQAGMIVIARWTQPYIPATSGHNSTHNLGGTDEIDITKLKNFNEQVSSPLAQKVKQGDLVVSAKDTQFGAKGDGVTDDTTALQAFINYVANNKLEGKIPAGNYIISNELTIPSTPLWKISGANALSTTITQKTDNKAIFHFISTPSNAFGIKITDIGFDYKNSQPSTNTSANPIQIDTMLYECTFNDLAFNKGAYAIYVSDGTQNPWGCTFDNIRYYSGLTIGAFRMSSLNAVPNNKFGRTYCECNNMIGPVFNIKGYNFVIETIEFIQAYLGAQLMVFQAGAIVEIGAIKLENGTYTGSYGTPKTLFEFQPASKAHIGSINIGGSFLNIAPTSGSVYIVNSTGGGAAVDLTVGHIELGGSGPISSTYALGAIGSTVVHSFNITTSGFALTNLGGSAGAETLLVRKYQNEHLSQDKGDANYTVALGDPNTIQFNTVLTAPRTLTLPSDGTYLFNGLKYRVVVGANVATGTNTLTVNSNGTTLTTISTGKTVVEFIWRRVAFNFQNGWVMTGYNTLP